MENIMNMGEMQDLTGTKWWSRDGKEHFVVRDIIMDPAQGIIIQTMDGRMLSPDYLDRFIQSETPINVPKAPPKVPKINLHNLDPDTPITEVSDNYDMTIQGLEVADSGIYPEEYVEDRQINVSAPKQETKSTNYDIIDKAFSKIEKPSVTFNIQFKEFPNRELELLQDIMNIPGSEIAKYCCDRWFKDGLTTALSESFLEIFGCYDDPFNQIVD